MNIKENLKEVLQKIPSHVKLVAVSKTKTVNDIMQVYNEGIRDFGENKVQEVLSKYDKLPADIRWHLIGHLQTNKVKYIAPFVHCIQSVDSLKLIKEINKEALKNSRTIDCLLQMHIAKEETKFGYSLDELEETLQSEELKSLQNINIRGVMGMATFTDDDKLIREEFQNLADIFKKIKLEYFPEKSDFNEISMGMSSDFELAVSCGSTIVRVGSRIFGSR